MTNAELDDRLAVLLVNYGLVTAASLERARAFQDARRSTLGGALATLHLLQDDVLSKLLEELTGVRAVDPSLMTVYPDFVERLNTLVPPEVPAALLIFPAQMDVNTISICMLNPTDGWTARALEALSGCRVAPLVTHETALRRAIEAHYPQYLPGPPLEPCAARGLVERTYRQVLERPLDVYVQPAIALINRSRDALARDPRSLEAVTRDPHLIRLVQQLLCRAVEAGASDLHIEPTGDELRVRARIDGAMRMLATLPAAAGAPVAARLKVMAELPIQASAQPLDSRISYDLVLGRAIDLRLALVPAVTGETIVLRVLERTQHRRQITDLGVDEETRALLEGATDLPNGLILVTGPTGSGKSSTLYALLDRLNGEAVCIKTAEDPVESRLLGVTQVPCGETGISFAAALRSFLRQDPDVIMIGEIRDRETADVALKAALTGHLVLSTLHTNDAPSAILRLLSMELEPFLVASALRLVVAQRLVRTLCVRCKTPVGPDSDAFRTLVRALTGQAAALLQSGRIYEPVGCAGCAGVGYRGRTGLFEVLRVTEAIEELIIGRATAAAIRAAARAAGMRTLRHAGILKVARGETSIAELLEHTVADPENALQTTGGEMVRRA